jgi:phosphatidate cytidylyltransferase
MSLALCQFPFFVCPVEYSESIDKMSLGLECEPSYLFQPQNYNLPSFLVNICQVFGLKSYMTVYPFVLHSLSMSFFSSVIGPFGGFFASGFKRAFKIKVRFFKNHLSITRV